VVRTTETGGRSSTCSWPGIELRRSAGSALPLGIVHADTRAADAVRSRAARAATRDPLTVAAARTLAAAQALLPRTTLLTAGFGARLAIQAEAGAGGVHLDALVSLTALVAAEDLAGATSQAERLARVHLEALLSGAALIAAADLA
jgi:hypothetical protein